MESEFLPDGFFICDMCDEIHEDKNRHAVADMDGEDGDHWQLCPTCAEEIHTQEPQP